MEWSRYGWLRWTPVLVWARTVAMWLRGTLCDKTYGSGGPWFVAQALAISPLLA